MGRKKINSRMLERGSVTIHVLKIVEASLWDKVILWRMDLHDPGQKNLLSRTAPWFGVGLGHQGTHKILEFHLNNCW